MQIKFGRVREASGFSWYRSNEINVTQAGTRVLARFALVVCACRKKEGGGSIFHTGES